MPFNLLTESWIPVVSKDFQLKEISLVELFQSWESYKEIRGDNPPTTLAIYRFLLAILHRAYQGPTDEDHWEEIYEDDGEKAIAYLNDHSDCFDLFDPERPFMQDPSISSEKTVKCYSYLAHEMHGENTSTVFCHQHHWGNTALSLSEAARLILRLQSFDFYGRKMGATKRAGGIPMMNSINILICANTLKDSILRNLVRYSPRDEYPSVVNGNDFPSWERSLEKPGIRLPHGYIDYLSYQWRRIRLFTDKGLVVRVASHPGDVLPEDIFADTWECFTPYEKKEKGNFPIQLDANKSLWRDSSVFLQSAETTTCPHIFEWHAELSDSFEELIPQRVQFQVLGLQANQASPIKFFSERFSISIEFLKKRKLWDALRKAIAVTEEHQIVFQAKQGRPYFALAQVLKYNKASKLANSLDGESRYWAALDRAFPELLFTLPNDHETGADGITTYGNTELVEWTQTLQKVAKDAFTESIASIRNYEARAAALRSLSYHLAVLRGDIDPKAKRKSKSKKAAQSKAS